MQPHLCVDARMILSSGIGTYLTQLLPKMAPHFLMTLLVQKKEQAIALALDSARIIERDVPIYTGREQWYLPFVVPSCDLFWSPHYNVPVGPIRAKKRVVTVHDVCHLACPDEFSLRKRALAFLLMQQAIVRSDLILTVSKFSEQEILRFFPKAQERLHVISNGVSYKKEGDNAEFRSFNLNNPFLLYVGNVKTHKNIERLVQAFLQLPSCYDLVLAGSVSLPESQMREIRKEPRIKMLGEVQDSTLHCLYKNAKVLVHPSLYEGFGLTPLEAMALGCPVIVSTSGSLPEVCGQAVHYSNPYSIESLYLGMKEVLENDCYRQNLIRKGMVRSSFFSWEKTFNEVTRLFMKEAGFFE